MLNSPLRHLSEDTYNPAVPAGGSQITTLGRLDASDTIRPRERMKFLTAIDFLGKLPDDWNGRTAKKPSDICVKLAKNFIEKMPLNCLYPNTVSPNGDTTLSFIWKLPNETVIVTVDASILHLSHTYVDSNKEGLFRDDIPFDGDIIPQEIKSELPKRLPQQV